MDNQVAQIKTSKDVIDACNKLKDFWGPRDKKFPDWYDILLLKDEFEQDQMESFVSNDPKTFYNLSMHMLCDKIPHRIPLNDIDESLVSDATKVEDMISRVWKTLERNYRQSGRKGFLKMLAGLCLTTGWYCVFAVVDNLGFVADVWSPIEVYPEWDDDGLYRCARVYKLTKEKAAAKIAKMGWTYNKPINGDILLYNYWWVEYTKTGKNVFNAIVLDDVLVKNDAEKLPRIPIFIGTLGSMPDMGSIKPDDSWKEHIGESAFAANELMIKQYNKHWTFFSQILRDSAQPRWFEKSAEGNILTPDNLFKRGAIFRGGLNDSIQALPMPPIPVELSTVRFDMQNMVQRGYLNWGIWGNMQGQMSGYMLAQTTDAAKQVLEPYHQGIIQCLSDIDNFWLDLIRLYKYNPLQIKNLKVDPSFEVTAEYTIKIPGDMVQRATIARQIDPDFRLSFETVLDMVFPELTNPIQEQSLVRKDDANRNPITVQINLITAYKQMALNLQGAGDPEQAALFDKASKAAEAQLDAMIQQATAQNTGQPGTPGGGELPPGPRPEAYPNAAQTQAPAGGI
jgi:hypothetical protein